MLIAWMHKSALFNDIQEFPPSIEKFDKMCKACKRVKIDFSKEVFCTQNSLVSRKNSIAKSCCNTYLLRSLGAV